MMPRELLKKIRKIEIVTERLVRERLAGQYHSVFKGRGMAFGEVRQYLPGDDVRLIDWNVTARMNDAYVKLFVEEREMTVMLRRRPVGARGASARASSEKRELAAEVAALLAFSAIKNNDRVGLIIFTDEVERFVPPKKGKKHVLRVISEILAFRSRAARTDLASGSSSWGTSRAGARSRSWSPTSSAPVASYERALRIARAAPRPGAGVGERSARGGAARRRLHRAGRSGDRRAWCCSTPAGRRRRAFARAARARASRRARRCSSGWTMDSVDVRTDRPYLPALITFFEARARRLRH